MPIRPDGLDAHQRAAATSPGGPLLVLGGAGTGKTEALLARFHWLDAPPERVLVLAPAGRAEGLCAALEASLEGAWGGLAVHAPAELCLRLLREEAAEAGLDPFVVPLGASDRLALLLERHAELPLEHHDLGGHPAALLASVLRRIDALKAEGVTAEECARWARELGGGPRGAREREFAALYELHERGLGEAGALAEGDLALRAARLLEARPQARARVAARFDHLLVDDAHDLSPAEARVVALLATAGPMLWATADPAAPDRALRALAAAVPGLERRALREQHRCPPGVARVVAALAEGSASRDAAGPGDPAPPTEVELWRCAGERAQAQAVAADLERLTLREGVAPERCCVVVEDVRRDAQPVALALEERAVPHEVVGADAFFQRGEVRDVLAWLRLLIDPADAGAAVRALSRPPVELRTIDVARVTQIARRRKLDMVAACAAATESPQVPPEARERLHAFLRLQRELAEGLDELRPERYVHRLVERLGLRRQLLFAARRDAVLRLRNLARLAELAAAHTRRVPDAGPREFARALAAMAEAGLPEPEATADDGPRGVAILATDHAHGREWDVVYVLGLRPAPPPLGVAEPLPGGAPAPDPAAAERARLLVACSRARERLVLATPGPPSPLAEAARQALGAEWQDRDEELFGPAETLHATFRLMRDELMRDVSRVGTRLAELRFDTDLDIAHAVTRYLELLKLSALIARAGEQGVAEALPEVNERLLQAATAGQREILETSALDEHLLDAERSERRRAAALAARDEPSLLPFLPTRGDGLALSASDIETYRACPLRYKFARVVRIPAEPTLNQRFGILVHQVLERWHGAAGGRPGSLAELLGLLEAGWRRAGLGSTGLERQLRAKATAALTRYHQRAEGDQAEAVWFERPFAFRIGPHVLRGRVDRVDRRPDGTHELIDYKTGRPRSADQLRDDVQLSLYALGAAEAWQLESATQAYWYVLDDVKVEVPAGEVATAPVRDTVLRVGEAILAQEFEPTPSPAACGACDYRLMCPAAER